MKKSELIRILESIEGDDTVILDFGRYNDTDGCSWSYVKDVDVDYINEVNRVVSIR